MRAACFRIKPILIILTTVFLLCSCGKADKAQGTEYVNEDIENEDTSSDENIKEEEQSNDKSYEELIGNMEIPVTAFCYISSFSESKAADVNDPGTFWRILCYYARMEMEKDKVTGDRGLVEKYYDAESGEMLVLSEESVRDAVNVMMPTVSEYPAFPDSTYVRYYKKDGDYYLPCVELDAILSRMTNIKINDDGTASVVLEWLWGSEDSDIYEAYQLDLVKNESINPDSPEPYPYCIKSIRLMDPAEYMTQKKLTEMWHQSYLEAININSHVAACAETCRFGFIYLDGDEVPELLIDFGVDGYGTEIHSFQYYGVAYYPFSGNSLFYCEREGIIYDAFDKQGTDVGELAYLDEEGFRYYRQNIQNGDNPDGAGTDYFEWNDGEMSEVAYRQIVKEIDYENVKKWDPYSEDMKGNSYTLSEIREYLTQGGR